MPLTANRRRRHRGRSRQEFQIVDALTVFDGGIAALNHPVEAGAALQGRIQAHNDVATLIPLGILRPQGIDPATGDTGALPIVTGEVELEGAIEEALTITGVSTVDDEGSIVFATGDDPAADLTLVRPTLGIPFGVVVRHRTGAVADVYRFSFAEISAISLGGAGQYTWHLGTVVTELGAAADMATGITAPHHGEISNVYAICASAPVDADMNMDIQLEIDGVNTTGGIITLNFADAIAANKAGTAITAGEAFREGSLIDIEALAAGFVAGTAGDGVYNVYAEVQTRLGY